MGVILGVLMFSLAGMTPTAGFFGKYYLFKLAVDQNMIALAVIAVFNSFVSAYYYLKVVAALYTKPEGAPAVLLPSSLAFYLTFFLCAAGVLVIGFLKFPF
jgi:NADH-quinone oxidoreductase subunit N